MNVELSCPDRGECIIINQQQKSRELIDKKKEKNMNTETTESSDRISIASSEMNRINCNYALDASGVNKNNWRKDGSKRYVVFPRGDIKMKASATLSMKKYQIPRKNISEHGKSKGFYSSFESLDLNSKLDIHGHANIWEFDYMSAKKLADNFEAAGLKSVGVIKFKTCDIGKGRYLEDLRSALTEKNIKVGYVSAPKYGYRDSHIDMKIMKREFHPNVVPCLPSKMIGFPFLPSRFGRKVIKGNADNIFYENEPKYKAGFLDFG